eukprot:g25969.t2
MHLYPQPKSSSRRNSPRAELGEGAGWLPCKLGEPDVLNPGQPFLLARQSSKSFKGSKSKDCFGSALRPYQANWEVPSCEASERSKDNSDIPSWIPGYPGIDKGTIHFTYAKDTIEVILLLVLGWFYKKRIVSKRPALPAPTGAEDFSKGPFSCYWGHQLLGTNGGVHRIKDYCELDGPGRRNASWTSHFLHAILSGGLFCTVEECSPTRAGLPTQ